MEEHALLQRRQRIDVFNLVRPVRFACLKERVGLQLVHSREWKIRRCIAPGIGAATVLNERLNLSFVAACQPLNGGLAMQVFAVREDYLKLPTSNASSNVE